MKRSKVEIKKRIAHRMNDRDLKRIYGDPNARPKPKPIHVGLVSREEHRTGIRKAIYTKLNVDVFSKEYNKKTVVDYDAVVIISSFDRFKKLCRIFKELHQQESKYKIKIIIYNDGSTDMDYDKIPELYPDVIYLNNEVNNGKHMYWETITTLFKKASEFVSHVVIQIDDDFILCENFIDNLIDKFFESKGIDNRNVGIHYHIPKGAPQTYWGMNNWVDGGAIFDTEFLLVINNTVDPISTNRWKGNPELSSGVWHQISKKIEYNQLLTYKLKQSLARHDGNTDSKMNTEQRNRSSIHTHNFKKN